MASASDDKSVEKSTTNDKCMEKSASKKSLDKSSGESHADCRPGPEIFLKNTVPLQQKVVGNVNGCKFTIIGKGALQNIAFSVFPFYFFSSLLFLDR